MDFLFFVSLTKRMKRIHHIYLLFLVFIVTGGQMLGQKKSSLEYGIGYFGNTWINPGLEFSMEYPLINTRTGKSKYSDLGESMITLQGSAAAYWDPFSHVGLLNYYQLNFKQYFGKRLGIQMGFGFVLQSNVTGDNYVVDEDFQIEEQGFVRNNYGGIHISGGFFVDNKYNNRGVLNKMSLYVLAPHNAGILPVFSYHFIYLMK